MTLEVLLQRVLESDGLLATGHQDSVACCSSTMTNPLPCGELGRHQGMREHMPYAISPGFARQSDNDDDNDYGVVVSIVRALGEKTDEFTLPS